MLGWVSHLGLMWENPEHRRFVEALAREHTVIRYDKVGCGLSDRTRTTSRMESELAACEALVEHLDLDAVRAVRLVRERAGRGGVRGRHPDVLSSLIVYGSCARGADLAPDEVKRSVLALVRAHWGLGSRVLADIWFPDAPAELTAMFARVQRAAATADSGRRRCWTCSTGSTSPTCCRWSGCRRSWRTGGAAGRSGSSSAGSWPR